MRSHIAVLTFCLAGLAGSVPVPAQETLVLENGRLGLSFDRTTGFLVAIQNKLCGETYQLRDEAFDVEAVEFRTGLADARLASLEKRPDAVKARYEAPGLSIDVSYELREENAFVEKRLVLSSTRSYGLVKLTLSRPTFSAAGLRIVAYRYPKFGRKPGEEPTVTFFGRTAKGGVFAGVEVPFDSSSVSGQQVVLQYAPSLKVAAGEKLACEPVYFGVYRKSDQEQEAQDLPLRSESEAMVAMTSAILGPPRFGLVPMACGWHSEMEQGTYTERSVTGDVRSLDFLAECGVDWLSDSHPWGGETEKMNTLGAGDKYQPGPAVRKFLEHAEKVGVRVVMWTSMNKTHAWSAKGKPFRPDKPEWLMTPGPSVTCPGSPAWLKTAKGNCLPNKPFFDWLVRITLEGMAAGRYKSWAMDGDFFGGGGWYTSVIPVDCQSAAHDHLAGDSNYACQRALAQLTAAVRGNFPQTYIFMCRPPMDLGVWSLPNVDACFTLLESGTGKDNLVAGDHLRTWSRMRVHRDFFPHYLDQPLLFPSRSNPAAPPSWPRGHLDYILLSALSSAPNQLLYLPTKSGIPAADKAEIRKWLDWGRKNIEYLKVRKDLPDWPAKDKVDGSAHVVEDRGVICLFNPSKSPLEGRFALTAEEIGLAARGTFRVMQEYPPSDRQVKAAAGEVVSWPVPGETVAILRLEPLTR